MSPQALFPDPTLAGELPEVFTAVPPDSSIPDSPIPGSRIPRHVARHMVRGTSMLGLGVLIERGAGFAANILAARFAGAPVFGAYSLALSTATNISAYAAGGIGATATRFSGKYAYGTAGYATLARALAVVSVASATLAALGLWLGAGPIALLLHKATLTGLLRWASISAVGIILLECARGFFVGQRRLAALVLLSLITGAGMLSLLPWMASTHRPVRMVVAQGAVTLTAVSACLLLARPLGLFAPASSHSAPGPALRLGPMLKEVWSFGFIQLAGLVGANLAGWWLTALVARGDTTLVEISFFAIASQLRNLVGLAPGLLTEGSYAVMADPEGEHLRTPHRVMALCAYASTVVALGLASLGILAAPWGLRLLYGRNYGGAAIAAAIALAVAVVHMGNAPAAARLTIVSIRATGIINTIWAAFVALAGTLFLLHGGNAAEAMAIYFGGHVLSAALVLAVLYRKDHIPAGMVQLFLLSTGTVVALAALAIVRGEHARQSLPIAALMLLTLLLSSGKIFALGKRHEWLPTAAAVHETLLSLASAGGRFLRWAGRRNLYGA